MQEDDYGKEREDDDYGSGEDDEDEGHKRKRRAAQTPPRPTQTPPKPAQAHPRQSPVGYSAPPQLLNPVMPEIKHPVFL